MRCHICDYDTGPDCIRDHLVAKHAPLVAKSLLAPDLANPIDAWLMTCVEYSNAFRTAEAVVAEEEADEAAADPLLLGARGNDDAAESIALNGAVVGGVGRMDEDEEEGEEGNDYFESLPVLNGNGLKMEIRLDGVGTPDEQSPAPSDGDRHSNNRRRRKRTPTRRNEDGDTLLLASAGDAGDPNDVRAGALRQTGGGKRPKLEQFFNADDKQYNQRQQPQDDYDENELGYGGSGVGRGARESPALSTLNDSKAVRRVMCQLCRVDVCATARQRHVYLIHLKQPDLFTCSQCDYTNSNSIWETRKHCVAQHGPQAQAVSNEERHRADIQAWNQRCFPEWKQKRPAFWWKVDEPPPASFDQQSNSSIAAEDSPDIGEDELDSEQVSLFDEDENSRSCSAKPPDGVVVDDRTCHLCWEESRYPGRHIAQKHLKKPLYECPVCEGFGSYESCTVAKHLIKVHPEHGETQPVSNLEKYADEIRDLQARCFPNRPMKLVRPHAGSRPRERHHCQLCGAQVAQSDRQRHVYHRHLQRTRIFECPLCSFASNYDVHRVKWHIKWMHKEESNVEPVSHENEYRDDIDALNEQCFPGWQHRRRPFWWLDNEEAQARVEQVKIKKTPAVSKKDKEERLRESPPPPSPSSPGPQASTSQNSNGGKESPTNATEWTCQLCKKEFKPSANFLRHVAKDHLNMPLYQCPICEGHGGHDAYEIRSHMLKVHGNADQEPISNIEEHCDQIQEVYSQCFPGRRMRILDKRLSFDMKTYDEPRVQCRECGQEMKTEDRQIHVYRHHLKEPRLYECPLCDFAHHACSSDVKAHIKYVHRDQADLSPKANLLQFAKEIAEWNDRCFPGWINRRLPAAALEDFNRCRICDIEVRQTSRHIAEVHLHMSLHQCPLCEYGAAESRLVRRHMKNNHKKKEIKGLEPIANVVEHRQRFSELHDRCFPGRPKRLSNITISDEGRRAKCRQCGATISRKRRLSHIFERHLKKPIYKCPKCPFNSQHDESTVEAHIADIHADLPNLKIICDAKKHKAQIEKFSALCFTDWKPTL